MEDNPKIILWKVMPFRSPGKRFIVVLIIQPRQNEHPRESDQFMLVAIFMHFVNEIP
jgi:hypothetical protein